MEHQDWQPLVFKKNKKEIEKMKKAKGEDLVSVKKRTEKSKLIRNLEEDDVTEVPIIKTELKQKITQARISKKLTQKQLATAINEKEDVIKSYESGKAVPNNQILSKLSRVLGVRLSNK